MSNIFQPLTLPNGQTISNRLCKAAMEENMAEAGQVPGGALVNLYQQWADGGVGIILTGNVMVSPTAMTGPGGVYLGAETLAQGDNKQRFMRWAETGKSGGAKLYMQISHPGRQIYAAQGTEPVSASATRVKMDGPAEKMFTQARALTGDEIRGIIKRFADTAHAAEMCGFDGVQIHAAHGYLLAQFLSPLTNLREDEWGGPLENRARLLLEVVREVRARVEPGFGVAVKLNSADFQKGGYDIGDAKRVVDWLNGEDVDFIEISGGSYESAAMMGLSVDGRAQTTLEREMYFIDFAKDIAEIAKMPLMVTGGVTKRQTAEDALADGQVAMIGIGRAMGYNPNIPNDWKRGENLHVPLPVVKWKNPLFKGLANMAMTKTNLYRMGNGLPPKTSPSPLFSTLKQQAKNNAQTKRYKKWLETRSA
jgi:2,4-dienoyl-CoA reductase-like NADH-dependent reductase (Old Yellow Enzyme family)